MRCRNSAVYATIWGDMAEQRDGDDERTAPWVYPAAVVIVLGLIVLFLGLHLAGGGIPTH